jgi:hypothetical protein
VGSLVVRFHVQSRKLAEPDVAYGLKTVDDGNVVSSAKKFAGRSLSGYKTIKKTRSGFFHWNGVRDRHAISSPSASISDPLSRSIEIIGKTDSSFIPKMVGIANVVSRQ